MNRAKKTGQTRAAAADAGGPMASADKSPDSSRPTPGSLRSSAGGLTRAGKNTTTSRSKPKATAAKSLKKHSNDGSQAPKPTSETMPQPTQSPPARARQQKAEARVKDTQIKQAGLESRLLGHVSASVKRSQARRDSKNG